MTETMKARAMSGEQLKSGLIDAAQRLGFLVHWQTDSRKTDTGWPDILCVGHGVVVAIECKSRGETLSPGRVTRKGRQMPSQADWLTIIGGTQGCAAYVCRPRAEDVLGQPSGPWEETHYDAMLAILQLVRDRAMRREAT